MKTFGVYGKTSVSEAERLFMQAFGSQTSKPSFGDAPAQKASFSITKAGSLGMTGNNVV